jgi:hypothetical protein
MKINVSLAVFNLFPFFTLIPALAYRKIEAGMASRRLLKEIPYVEGEFVFFGSPVLWVLSFSFILILGLSLFFFDILFSLIVALFASIGLWILWQSKT